MSLFFQQGSPCIGETLSWFSGHSLIPNRLESKVQENLRVRVLGYVWGKAMFHNLSVKTSGAPPPCLLSSVQSTAAGAPVDSSAWPPGLGTIVATSS